MFLVTTADQRFWKQNEPIIFLGEWCRIYNQKSVWSHLKHEVLPYHGFNRDALYSDYKYSMDIYERLLVQLSESLNVLHGTEHSVRYWRIVLGPWLSHFVEILLDRYRSICVAIDSSKVTNTWITEELSEELIPNDFSEFRHWFVGDQYNHYLYSQIIKAIEKIPWEAKKGVSFSQLEPEITSASVNNKLKWFVIGLLGMCSRLVPDFFQRKNPKTKRRS